MPESPKHPCRRTGCPNLVELGKGLCSACFKVEDKRQGSASSRGYDASWRKFVKWFRTGSDLHPQDIQGLLWRNQCAVCGTRNNLQYDHIVPMSSGGGRFDIHNIQPLCQSDHARKTLMETKEGIVFNKSALRKR